MPIGASNTKGQPGQMHTRAGMGQIPTRSLFTPQNNFYQNGPMGNTNASYRMQMLQNAGQVPSQNQNNIYAMMRNRGV